MDKKDSPMTATMTLLEFGQELARVLTDHTLIDRGYGPECLCGLYRDAEYMAEAAEGWWLEHVLAIMSKNLSG